MRSKAVRRLQLERELRRALDREELSLEYQPIVALATGEIPALEALLRWDHPERGSIEPSEFIPVAEESGLIHPIGRWVIERACQQSVAWHSLRPDARPIDMTVNLSVRQFAQHDLPEIVTATLSRTGLEAVHLKFEITESVLVEKSGAADEMLRELSGLGVQLILDDFGTGYSSLAYLKHLPLDTIKIDRSFVNGLDDDDANLPIVQAVIALAHGLGIEVVAEGIETVAQLDRLRLLGCDRGQGYLYARPMPADELVPMLAANRAGAEIVASRVAASAGTARSLPVRARPARRKRQVAATKPVTWR
jgi:EAL domain-containing protein (putative c-di-GMP-specific phosphodiesterase class I)